MHKILTKITVGEGTPEDLEKLQEVAQVVKDTSLCGLGNTAPNPVLTTMKYFLDEYKAHIYEKRCPSKICRPLLAFSINAESCVENGHGCGQCKRNCPDKAITGKKGQAHRIDPDKCGKCGICFDVCKFNAVVVK